MLFTVVEQHARCAKLLHLADGIAIGDVALVVPGALQVGDEHHLDPIAGGDLAQILVGLLPAQFAQV